MDALLLTADRVIPGPADQADAGWRFTPFDAAAREMELLHQCGLTPAAAQALGLDRETGTLAPGFAAGLIAVPGDPLADLTALRRPALVMRAGEVVIGGK